MSSLYIHIPFCQSKCGYCSFASWPGLEHLHENYVRAVIKELGEQAAGFKRLPLSTIFLGGGTPSILETDQLERVIDSCFEFFTVEKDAEISLEANPGTVDRKKLTDLKRAGFSRISIGVQSFLDIDLQALGRCHSRQQAIAAYEEARSAGFENISLDLMYGLPGQTVAGWRRNLETAIALEPEHLSMYQLTIEDHTRFAELYEEKKIQLPDEEEVVAMDELNLSLCAAAGYEWYEISNYARPGFQCRHNLNYWHNGEYLAAGAGAVSFLEGVRERRVDDPSVYIARVTKGENPIQESEKLARDESFRETVIMGLRLTEGVNLGQLQARFGMDPKGYYGNTLEKLMKDGLLACSDTHLRVTERGRLFSNWILSELV